MILYNLSFSPDVPDNIFPGTSGTELDLPMPALKHEAADDFDRVYCDVAFFLTHKKFNHQ